MHYLIGTLPLAVIEDLSVETNAEAERGKKRLGLRFQNVSSMCIIYE